jgi:hypothetical protein
MQDAGVEPGPFAFLSRRRFLKAALGGGAVVLGGAAGGALALRGCAPSVDGLRVLSDHQYRTLTALAETHLPAGGAFEAGATGRDLPRLFDAFLADEPAQNIADLKRALVLVEFGPVVFDFRIKTFSNLDAEARLAHWQGWIDSDSLLRRQVAIAFRRFLALVFYDHPSVWPAIGYGGPSLYGMPK